MSPNTDTVWVVTVCSTGLGRGLAKRVLQQGHRCAVTARNLDQIEDFVAEYPTAAKTIASDVSGTRQVRRLSRKWGKRFAASMSSSTMPATATPRP